MYFNKYLCGSKRECRHFGLFGLNEIDRTTITTRSPTLRNYEADSKEDDHASHGCKKKKCNNPKMQTSAENIATTGANLFVTACPSVSSSINRESQFHVPPMNILATSQFCLR